ncbi:MAG: MFS transporter [Anaerolineales bacterium]|jgi:GPH family glycoside/pentoside/hexuronide:cation symporter
MDPNAETATKAVESSKKAPEKLSFWAKLVYGSGDWGMSSFGTLRQVFYLIFVVDVVKLEPRLASLAVSLGVIWDAINDPLVGVLTDRVRTRWGRRRPFLLFFAIPFSLGFLVLWWAPPWKSQGMLMLAVTLAYMISDTLQTLVSVPFMALTPEIAPGYDERTSLAGYRMVFNLVASLATVMVAPMIVDGMANAGFTEQQGYLLNAALFGGLAALPFLVMFFVIRERRQPDTAPPPPRRLRDTTRELWRNVPFRFAALLYMLNWITFDLVAGCLPFFLIYWVAGGNLRATTSLFGMELPLESGVLGLLLIVATLALPLWTWLARRFSKRSAYITGMLFWAVVQVALIAIRPGQIGLVMFFAVLSGLSVSTAHVLPDAIFPDVIEWDELYTGQRREGMYYGAKNLIRKLTGAIAISIPLQVLGWLDYVPPPDGADFFRQSDAALTAIRVLTGPVGAVLLISAILVAWAYPLTRERHGRVRRLLARRAKRRAAET